MSLTAHKKANRSAIKQAWNHMPPKLRVVAPVGAAVSWWTAGSSPDARDKFVALARERDRHVWSNIVPHAMITQRGEFG